MRITGETALVVVAHAIALPWFAYAYARGATIVLRDRVRRTRLIAALLGLLVVGCSIPGPVVPPSNRCRNVALFVPVGSPPPVCPHWDHTPPLEDGTEGNLVRYLCYCADVFSG